jgi:hypothetical protein
VIVGLSSVVSARSVVILGLYRAFIHETFSAEPRENSR